jgi:hypothetical protein
MAAGCTLPNGTPVRAFRFRLIGSRGATSVLFPSEAATGTKTEPVRDQQARVDGSRVAGTLEHIAPEPAPERTTSS